MGYRVMRGIIFVIRNGLRWLDVPASYGPHKTIYNRSIRWSEIGVFGRIFVELAKGGGDADEIMVDANPATFLRCIELPEAITDGSLTGLKLKLIKIGAYAVRHARTIVAADCERRRHAREGQPCRN